MTFSDGCEHLKEVPNVDELKVLQRERRRSRVKEVYERFLHSNVPAVISHEGIIDDDDLILDGSRKKKAARRAAKKSKSDKSKKMSGELITGEENEEEQSSFASSSPSYRFLRSTIAWGAKETVAERRVRRQLLEGLRAARRRKFGEESSGSGLSASSSSSSSSFDSSSSSSVVVVGGVRTSEPECKRSRLYPTLKVIHPS